MTRISDEELEQWAKTRADDAGRLARELLQHRLTAALASAAELGILERSSGYYAQWLANKRPEEAVFLTETPADDWTVSASETARAVLDYLGTGSNPSLEPGSDRRRDDVAKIITKHFDRMQAEATVNTAEPVTRQSQLMSVMTDAVESARDRAIDDLLIKLNGLAAKNDAAFRSALTDFAERFASARRTQ